MKSDSTKHHAWHWANKIKSLLVPNPRASLHQRIASPKLPHITRFEYHLNGRFPIGGKMRFSKKVVHYIQTKGILIMEAKQLDEESCRKARVHAIASGSETVLPLIGWNRFIFINPLDGVVRAKRILERLGYTADAFLFRFDPDAVLCPEEFDSELWSSKMPRVSGMLLRAKPRITNVERPWTEVLQIRGPGNSAFLIEMHQSKDVYEMRFLLKNFILGKHKCKYEESGIPEFERNGYITTKPLQRYQEVVKKAGLHSSAVGAEKVIEIKGSKQLQFVCKPNRLLLTARKLGIFGYEIDSTGVTYFPLHMVYLDRKDRITCDKFRRVMDTLPNVVRVYDNIFR